MPPPLTANSFQGQECGIFIVIMGTTHPMPGPGFTSQEQRLNVIPMWASGGRRYQCHWRIAIMANEKGKAKDCDKEFLGEDTTETYFTKGLTLNVDMAVGQGGSVIPCNQHRIAIKFPRRACSYLFSEAPKSILDRFPGAKSSKKGLTSLRVCLKDETCVTVTGFGLPFVNVEDAEVEGWVNDNKPIVDNYTVLDVLKQRSFFIVIDYPVQYTKNKLSEDLWSPPFSYPYGTEQRWDIDKFKDLIKAIKGDQFAAIAAAKFPAYFVRPDSGVPTADTDRFFVVATMRAGFKKEHESSWRRLSETESFLLHLYDNAENSEPDAKNMEQSKIVVISPYAANVEYIQYLLHINATYEAIKGIRPASTIDSFQGQENDIVIAVMGTVHPMPEPGFTSQKERLNVILTRYRCGLMVVSDINVVGELAGCEGKSKGKVKAKEGDKSFGGGLFSTPAIKRVTNIVMTQNKDVSYQYYLNIRFLECLLFSLFPATLTTFCYSRYFLLLPLLSTTIHIFLYYLPILLAMPL
ncbi:hypothetical protein TrVFT333_009832 [Trichoderma virens FT-333]|nr:hypothetical protein TrVFT333_009832 [Trichoderma virens FT-333]